MIEQTDLAGSFTVPGTSIAVNRMGYGAMQLAGQDGEKLVWGPPRDVEGAIAVLREAVAKGVNHIDTADFYGAHVTNRIIRKALSPYPDDLVIVTKVSARRGEGVPFWRVSPYPGRLSAFLVFDVWYLTGL
jgi:aryl-alcohol dehydrogenase-like predicted oxidoreductase